MNATEKNTLYQALLVGAIAGARAGSAPALISNLVTDAGPYFNPPKLLKFFGKPIVGKGLKFMAGTEFIMDKSPWVGNRIEAPSLVVRTLSGAVAGAVVAQVNDQKVLPSIIAGGLAAIAATYGLFYLRKTLSQKANIPDTILGLAEDALVVSSSKSFLKTA